ncbi:MAG: L,D-transpeptidase family protein [Opitutaceae bacterium]
MSHVQTHAHVLGAILALAAGACPLAGAPDARGQPLATSEQLIVCVSPAWDSHRALLQCFERNESGSDSTWRAASPAMPALVGRNGLAWGRGLAIDPSQHDAMKKEGDGCSPAGIFEVGPVFGYAPQLPAGADYPYHQVTIADAWIDDPAHPRYNEHIVVDPADPPPWFERARMRLGDPAYRWLIAIRHNPPPALPGAGSAIFLHIRRGEDRQTTGCTALAGNDLEWIVRWLRADRQPRFVALPATEYQRLWRDWSLPDPKHTALLAD